MEAIEEPVVPKKELALNCPKVDRERWRGRKKRAF